MHVELGSSINTSVPPAAMFRNIEGLQLEVQFSEAGTGSEEMRVHGPLLKKC